ncbi:hypothetical protein AAHE18_12G219800 [Arachis hypogaea]
MFGTQIWLYFLFPLLGTSYTVASSQGMPGKIETVDQSSMSSFMLYMCMLRIFQSKKSHSIGERTDLRRILEGWDTTFFATT